MNAFEEFFWSKVERSPDGRWEWKGYIDSAGYGMLTVPAHRIAYMLMKGTIPDGLALDHLCRDRNCVNPDHLEPVTHKTNILRGNGWGGLNSRKTHCRNGHEYTPENTYNPPKGGRVCLACKRARAVLFSRKTKPWLGNEGQGSFQRNKTHCPQGHEYTPENTHIWNGHRECKTCKREKAKARYHAT